MASQRNPDCKHGNITIGGVYDTDEAYDKFKEQYHYYLYDVENKKFEGERLTKLDDTEKKSAKICYKEPKPTFYLYITGVANWGDGVYDWGNMENRGKQRHHNDSTRNKIEKSRKEATLIVDNSKSIRNHISKPSKKSSFCDVFSGSMFSDETLDAILDYIYDIIPRYNRLTNEPELTADHLEDIIRNAGEMLELLDRLLEISNEYSSDDSLFGVLVNSIGLFELDERTTSLIMKKIVSSDIDMPTAFADVVRAVDAALGGLFELNIILFDAIPDPNDTTKAMTDATKFAKNDHPELYKQTIDSLMWGFEINEIIEREKITFIDSLLHKEHENMIEYPCLIVDMSHEGTINNGSSVFEIGGHIKNPATGFIGATKNFSIHGHALCYYASHQTIELNEKKLITKTSNIIKLLRIDESGKVTTIHDRLQNKEIRYFDGKYKDIHQLIIKHILLNDTNGFVYIYLKDNGLLKKDEGRYVKSSKINLSLPHKNKEIKNLKDIGLEFNEEGPVDFKKFREGIKKGALKKFIERFNEFIWNDERIFDIMDELVSSFKSYGKP